MSTIAGLGIVMVRASTSLFVGYPEELSRSALDLQTMRLYSNQKFKDLR